MRILRDWLMTYQLTLKKLFSENPAAMAENEFCLRQLFQ
jgi:hypothetical protein